MSKSMIYAITDVGSNTVKCDYFRVELDTNAVKRIESLDFLSEKLGLIARVKDTRLSDDAISLLCDTVAKFQRRANELGVDRFAVFGTAVMRKINNFTEVADALLNNNGVKIELISGDEEARLSFTGATSADTNVTRGIMADMGGASTELIDFENDEIKKLHSFGFGCLYLYKTFVAGRFPNEAECKSISDHVKNELRALDFKSEGCTLMLIGGTGKAIKKLLCQLGYCEDLLSIEVLYKLAERFAKTTEEDMCLLESIIPTRVETILPGLTAYIAIAESINAASFTVSSGGIREGYLQKLIAKEQNI